MSVFILEVGVEELPARFLTSVQKELFEKFTTALHEFHLSFLDVEVFATPRRCVVKINDIANVSLEKEELVIGPSIKAAYDVGGRPTRALEGFAKTHGADPMDVFTETTEKGEYIAVRKKTGGESALLILSHICPLIITGLSFPKKMKWGSGAFGFARPLRWILAMLDDAVVPFSLAGLSSGNVTYGHRVHGSGPFSVAMASEYTNIIKEQGRVVISGAERIALIKEQGDALAAERGGKILWNDELLEEVQGLCEHPVPILGTFDAGFLEVPREVLLTSMQSHQKSFGVEDISGKLLPYFLTVLNISPKSLPLVCKGWERVLRARLEDGRFFWKNDLESGFEKWLEHLENVIFLAPLGSMADKTRRVAELAGWIANSITYVESNTQKAKADDAIRAGRLSKADLVSEMVNEFDTLQGIMGGIYAEKMGESAVVAKAIAEQYLPSGPDSPVPSSITGSIISMADKIDTLVGCFGLGMIPTGTTDPYGLRRAILGVIRILLENKLRISLTDLFARAQTIYGERNWKLDSDQAIIRLKEFTTSRLKNHFTGENIDTLFVESILLADADDAWAAKSRLEALLVFSKTDQFSSCAQTFKRVANIVRKQVEKDASSISGHYSKELLQDAPEIALADKLEVLEPVFSSLWEQEKYVELFELITELRPFIDTFFEEVMVMCENVEVRNNRLNLLQSVLIQFDRLADFSALQM